MAPSSIFPATGVSGNHIDVFFDTEAECTKFGRKRDRTIYILD